jgi:hypothetical protein
MPFIYISHFSFHESNSYLLRSGCRIYRITELRARMRLHYIYIFEALSLGSELSVMAIQTLIMKMPGFNHSQRYAVNKKKVKYIMTINNNIFILIYIQQDAIFHSLFHLETALNVSGGTCTHHQERKQLYLQHLAGNSSGVTNTRFCRYSCLRS